MTELRCKLVMETYRLDCQQNIYLINYAAEGGCGSWFCFGLFFYVFSVLSVSRPKLPLGQLSSPDDVIISQLQTISQLF